jgi:histidine triad (HIT) family protein
MDCVFCAIAAGQTDTPLLASYYDSVVFEPLNPVTPGHVLVVPKRHVQDFTDQPIESAKAMLAAGEYATAPCNLITSAGADATQTVFHTHLHIVPRTAGDGLHLPWTGQTDG